MSIDNVVIKMLVYLDLKIAVHSELPTLSSSVSKISILLTLNMLKKAFFNVIEVEKHFNKYIYIYKFV